MNESNMPKWFDVTVSCEAMKARGLTEEGLQEWLDKNCERWAYGREAGEGGFIHLQMRFVLKKESSLNAVSTVWKHVGHVSVTGVTNFDYVMKEGSYVLSWTKALRKYATIQLREWQNDALQRYREQDDRKILLILDRKGNTGKTWLARHIVATGAGRLLPMVERGEDLVAVAMAQESKGYVIDVPRAGGLSKSYWAGIEQIKSGHLYDKRYQWRENYMEPPKIMVFSNKMPNRDWLSTDRWEIITL